MKKCYKCQQVKSKLEFYKNKSKYDGLSSACKECKKMETSKEYRKEYQKKYTQSDIYKQKILENKAAKLAIKKQKKKEKKLALAIEKRKKLYKKLRDKAKRKKSSVSTERHRKLYPIRAKARENTYRDIKAGLIIRPSNCQKCNKQCIPDAHHLDYNNYKNIIFLCKECHRIEHNQRN